MKRYIFYLGVSLLAFGVGISFVYFYFDKFQWHFEQPQETIEERVFQNHSSNIQKSDELSRKTEFLTNKEKAFLLFESIINKWLKGQKIESLIEPSPELVQRIKESRFIYADEQGLLQNAEKNYQPTFIDVNSDGKNELAILSNCSEGDCQLWILKQTKRDFEVILSSYQEVANFNLQKSKRKGYFNIRTTQFYRNSKTSLGMRIYKFDGKEYYISDCFEYEFRYKDKNGNFHKLKKPKIYPLHCC
jgi:hypothetical protein